MIHSINEILLIVALFIVLDLVVIFCLLSGRFHWRKFKRIPYENDNILKLITGKAIDSKTKIPVSDYFEMKQVFELDETTSDNVEKAIGITKLETKYIRRLSSWSSVKRIETAVYLGFVGKDRARLALEKAILPEKNYPVKLYMANALADIGNKESIPVLISSLFNSHRWYRDRVNMLIAGFGDDFDNYLSQISGSERIEVKELIVDFASTYFSGSLKSYLIELIDMKEEAIAKLHTIFAENSPKEGNQQQTGKHRRGPPVSIKYEENYRKLIYKAAKLLALYYPKILDHPKYLNSDDLELRQISVEALSKFNTLDNFNRLLSYLNDDEAVTKSVIHTVSEIMERNPGYIHVVARQFAKETNPEIKRKLAEIIANKIEYFIMKLNFKSPDAASEIIKQIILLGYTSEVIDFINKNKDLDLENELLVIVKDVITLSGPLKDEFSRHLNERVAHKCGLTKHEEKSPPKEEQKDLKLIRNLYLILASIVIFFPALYGIRHYDLLLATPLVEQVKIFVLDFNYYLAFYSLTINLIYLTLLVFSYINAQKRLKLWKVKSLSLLFKPRILPSISILAPAFNEEKTIIESANSLLNLKYPDYELVIVNDGSKDNTLQVLIDYFDLTRVDYVFNYNLKTKPIHGVYMNRSIPKLIVVDKENGGKADSLNAGINISQKEYFCGIDSDSLLEDDALLKLASLTLDEGSETPALGGNIFPINGCTVERGQIKNFRIPDNRLARFQTIEYIRAFMAGRLGWAYLNSLLIISGAFGLFRKERVISVGGYLTKSGKYAKDTVGEDMELVVRISRLMRELGQRYRICYAFNANCWTEVPEDITSLKKQRYRWHKGLIDILTFHKKMIFNPSYGRTGLLAMPYFLIFEMVGPIVESFGYLMVGVAFLLGLLNVPIVLLLFISTILLGILVSISSLIIAEKGHKYFKLRDLMLLVFYAIIENFGPRQLISLWRVGGFFSMLKKPNGWDKPVRKGFAAKG